MTFKLSELARVELRSTVVIGGKEYREGDALTTTPDVAASLVFHGAAEPEGNTAAPADDTTRRTVPGAVKQALT